MIHFSPSTGGFHHPDFHTLPADAVAITDARHRQLLDGQSRGRAIVAGEGGRPVLAPVSAPHVDRLRGRAIAAVRAEARRRRLQVASPERQLDDVAALALSQVGILTWSDAELDAALVRRIRVRVIAEAAEVIEAEVATMRRDALAAFDPAADPRWPRWDD